MARTDRPPSEVGEVGIGKPSPSGRRSSYDAPWIGEYNGMGSATTLRAGNLLPQKTLLPDAIEERTEDGNTCCDNSSRSIASSTTDAADAKEEMAAETEAESAQDPTYSTCISAQDLPSSIDTSARDPPSSTYKTANDIVSVSTAEGGIPADFIVPLNDGSLGDYLAPLKDVDVPKELSTSRRSSGEVSLLSIDDSVKLEACAVEDNGPPPPPHHHHDGPPVHTTNGTNKRRERRKTTFSNDLITMIETHNYKEEAGNTDTSTDISNQASNVKYTDDGIPIEALDGYDSMGSGADLEYAMDNGDVELGVTPVANNRKARRATMAKMIGEIGARARSRFEDPVDTNDSSPPSNRYGPSNPYEPKRSINLVSRARGGNYGLANDVEEGKEELESDSERYIRRRSTAADVLSFFSSLSGMSDDNDEMNERRRSRDPPTFNDEGRSRQKRPTAAIPSDRRGNHTAKDCKSSSNRANARRARRRSTADALEDLLSALNSGAFGDVDNIDTQSISKSIDNIRQEKNVTSDDDESNDGGGNVRGKQNGSNRDYVHSETSGLRPRRRSTACALEAFLDVIGSGALGYVDDVDVASVAEKIEEIRQEERQQIGTEALTSGGTSSRARRRSTLELLDRAKERTKCHVVDAFKSAQGKKRRSSSLSTESKLLSMIGANLDEEEAQAFVARKDDNIEDRGSERLDRRESTASTSEASLDSLRALAQHVLNGRAGERVSSEEADDMSNREEALQEVKRRYTLYLLDKAKKRVHAKEDAGERQRRKTMRLSKFNVLGIKNGLFDEDDDNDYYDEPEDDRGWMDKAGEISVCQTKSCIILALVVGVALLVTNFVSLLVAREDSVQPWDFESMDIVLKPFDKLGPEDAYLNSDEEHQHVLVKVDDEDGLLAALTTATTVHLNISKSVTGETFLAIDVSDPALHLLEAYDKIQSVATDFPIQAIESTFEERRLGHHLDNTEEIPEGVKMIQGDQLPYTPNKKKVCVADTGYARGHPDLPDAAGADMVFDNGEIWPFDVDKNGHGTHICGTIAALDNNGMGIVGAARSNVVDLIVTRALRDDKLGSYGQLMKAINQCVDMGAEVIVLSLGCTKCHLPDMEEYFRNLVIDQGIMIIAAAGNENSEEPFYPASYEEVISVTANNRHYGKWGLSNYGDQIELSALGYSVLSTTVDSTGGFSYGYMSGTSMAAPQVAAVAAAVWAHFPECTNQDIRNALALTALDMNKAAGSGNGNENNNGESHGKHCDTTFGFGLVQATAAYDHLKRWGCSCERWILSETDRVCDIQNDLPPGWRPGGRSPGSDHPDVQEEINELKEEIEKLKEELDHRDANHELTLPPTTAPTRTPTTTSPTRAPTLTAPTRQSLPSYTFPGLESEGNKALPPCKDKKRRKFKIPNIRKKRTCSWVRKSVARAAKYCTVWSVQKYCQKTCSRVDTVPRNTRCSSPNT